jgi:hypothetical protein
MTLSLLLVFSWVWTYNVKTDAAQTKRARGVCDGSTRGGHVRTLDHTYASCVEQTSLRLFFALSALENKRIYGADVSNAFAEAPQPAQVFSVRVDRVSQHLKRTAIPYGHVFPVRRALPGHPESPRLWKRHVTAILEDLGFVPTTHEPCIYRGIVDGHSVLFLRQVDDFAMAIDDLAMYEKICDLIDSRLNEPIKRLGLLELYNETNIKQTRDYIRLHYTNYIDKILAANTWVGDSARARVKRSMGFSYRKAIGELIWAVVTCRPDLSFAVIKLSQSSNNPGRIHYNHVRHVFRYPQHTRDYELTY